MMTTTVFISSQILSNETCPRTQIICFNGRFDLFFGVLTYKNILFQASETFLHWNVVVDFIFGFQQMVEKKLKPSFSSKYNRICILFTVADVYIQY